MTGHETCECVFSSSFFVSYHLRPCAAVSTMASLSPGVPLVDGVPATDVLDGVSARQLFGERQRRSGVTFDDLIILPGAIDFGCDDVSLKTNVTRNISMNLPFVSSPMDTVTESEMAIHMALQGGLGVIHSHMSVEKQASEVRRVKRYKSGFITEPYCMRPDQRLADVDKLKEEKGITAVPITSTGRVGGKLLGILTSRDSDFVENRTASVDLVMTGADELITAPDGIDLEVAQEMLRKSKKGKLPIVNDQFELVSLIARTDIKKTRDYPLATKSKKDQNLCCAAAVPVAPSEKARIDALVAADVDILVLDAKQGDSEEQVALVQYIRSKYGESVDIIGGNVVTVSQVRRLIDAGIDGIRVGMGSGAISTSQIVKAVGRAQLSAVYFTAMIAREHGIPVIADGGVASTGGATKAIAIGASCVMMGSLLAGSKEAPGDYFFQNGTRLKKYRGMHSVSVVQAKAHLMDRGEVMQTFSHGVSGAVVDKGSVSRYVPYLAQSMRHGFQDVGARSIAQMHEQLVEEKLRFEIRSQAAQKEGGVHDLFSYKRRLFTS